MLHISNSSAVKKYRDFLNITQKELARDKFSVDTIQLLERGKRKLTIPTAGILVDNFNKLAEEKGIVLNLSIKDLMTSEEECVYESCIRELNKIEKKQFYIKNYLDILKTTEKYNFTDIQERVAYIIGRNFYYEGEYEKAIKYLEKSLKSNETLKLNNKPCEKTSILLNTIGACYLCVKDYSKAYRYINQSNIEFKHENNKDKSLHEKILFNLCLSLIGENKYNLALKYLDNLIDIIDSDNYMFIDTLIIKANILSNLDKNESAINLYKSILPKVDNKGLIYYNLSIIYNKLEDVQTSYQYAIKLIEIKSENTDEYTCTSLLHLGNLYNKKNLYKEALLMYDKAIVFGKKFSRYDEVIICYENIFKCYKKQKKLELFEAYAKNLLLDLDLFLDNKDFTNKILMLLVEYLNNFKNLDYINDILNKIRRHEYEKIN